jgi:low temperature requirement protein LtrA
MEAAPPISPVRHLRVRSGGEQTTTAVELFFDLVYVFAVTQLSHVLIHHLDWSGAAHAGFLLLVVWWAWIYTTWMVNWFDPGSPHVRVALIGVMAASLLLAAALPEAFGEHAALFVIAYVGLQVGRNATGAALLPASHPLRLSMLRLTFWSVCTGLIWAGGLLAHVNGRLAWWIPALLLELAGPIAGYWTPRLGRAVTTDWDIEGSHFAERCQGFIIIALGESIVITGATTADLDLGAARLAAFALAFLATAALWWLYFDYVARIAERRLELAVNRTALARDGYTYLHVLIVAGVIVSAVGDELVIAHPSDVLTGAEVAAVVAGPAIYLLAHVLFRLRLTGTVSSKRLGGALACLAVGLLGGVLPALALAAVLVAVLVAVIAAEQVAAHRRRVRGEASPLERLDATAAGSGP